MQHPPPSASVDADDRAKVDAAVKDYHARIAPYQTARLDWTDDMRVQLARKLIEATDWKAPTAGVDDHADASRADLNVIAQIEWFTELDHAEVRRLQDLHLAATGALEHVHATSKRYWDRARQRLGFAVAVCYRDQVRSHQPVTMQHGARRSRAARPRERRAAASSRSSGCDPGDSSGPSDLPAPAHLALAPKPKAASR